MTALPSAASFTGGSVTEAQFKTAITDLRNYLSSLLGDDGSIATALAALGAIGNTVTEKTAAYTLTTADRGDILNATTGTWTLTLLAASAAGNGFCFGLINSGTGTITIDPNASETIDGATTKAVKPGMAVIVVCNGTLWRTLGMHVPPATTAEMQAGTVADWRLMAPSDIKAAILALAPDNSKVRQVVSANIAAATGTASIPYDNTTPLSTEGTQIVSASITPENTSNNVLVQASFHAGSTGDAYDPTGRYSHIVAALFRGSTCIAVKQLGWVEFCNEIKGEISFSVHDAPATTSAVTYSIRVGRGTTGSTWYVGRSANTSYDFGGALATSDLILTEIAP